MTASQPGNPLPKVSAPAARALYGAGITSTAELSQWREADVLALHGMGPQALGILRDQLVEEGLDFAT